MTELGRGHFPILPPASFLIKIDIKGEGRSYPRVDGLFHFPRKTILHVETDLPNPIAAFHVNVRDGSFLAEGGERKDQDQKEGDPANEPVILNPVPHTQNKRSLRGVPLRQEDAAISRDCFPRDNSGVAMTFFIGLVIPGISLVWDRSQLDYKK